MNTVVESDLVYTFYCLQCRKQVANCYELASFDLNKRYMVGCHGEREVRTRSLAMELYGRYPASSVYAFESWWDSEGCYYKD